MGNTQYTRKNTTIFNKDSLALYDEWENPITIISDGAYGTGSFKGEPDTPTKLKEWYKPHIKKWSEKATPQTTLWFWNTEQGWAEVHPLLIENGWEYRGVNIWNKGIGHIAGNSNTKKMRKFPQVTEVCVHYVKEPQLPGKNGKKMGLQQWVISEWNRAGLTKKEANKACGVANAASRKYLTTGSSWYFPPPEKMEELAKYANKHGESSGKPYFVVDEQVVSADKWKKMRAKFDCPAGVTNVWNHPQVRGEERETIDGKAQHPNQKPLKLIKRIIKASTDKNDIVWAPFSGVGTVPVAAVQLNRHALAAEKNDEHYKTAIKRLKSTEI